MKNRNYYLIIIISLLVLKANPSSAQEVSWNSYSFGDVCCNDAAWINSIFTFSNGDVCLNVGFATAPGGFLKSTDNGKTWNYIFVEYFIFSGFVTAVELTNGKYLLSTYDYQSDSAHILVVDSLTYTLNSWKTLDNGIFSDVPVRTFAVDSSNNIFAVTFRNYGSVTKTGRIFYLQEGQTKWIQKSEGLPDSIEINTIMAIGNNVVLAGAMYKGIYRTSDNGDHWINANTGINELSIISFSKNEMGHVFAATNKGVLISKDNGANWDYINTGLPAKGIWSLAIDHENNLYVLAKDSSIYYSRNDGKQWQQIQNTPELRVFGPYQITVNSRGYLFLTNSNSIYYSINPVTRIESEESGVPATYNLRQNYPNPFNPSTTIGYEIPTAAFVSLKVYDLIGREVSVLIDEEQDAGYHDIKFNGIKLNSGVYFYKLSAGSISCIRKMVILK